MNLQWAKHPLARRMRAHGFGVHSPFAFDFIRSVLAQPCAYYCYADIAVAATSRRDAAAARLLFRVVLHFRPEVISLAPSAKLSAAMRIAIKAAMPQAEITGNPAKFMICSAPVKEDVSDGTVIFCTLPYTDPVAADNQTFGMSFAGSSGSVFTGLHHLPRQTFELTD